jgi:uncharacterized RmlC-like cupin family protein
VEFPRKEHMGIMAFDRRYAMSGLTDSKPCCQVGKTGAGFSGKQGHLLTGGISAQSVRARRIHLQLARIPPGTRSKAHKHVDHETAIYVLSDESGLWYGDRLEHHLVVSAGDILYVPADVPHRQFALHFARTEKRGGVHAIIDHQSVGYALADAKTTIEAARYLKIFASTASSSAAGHWVSIAWQARQLLALRPRYA